MTDPNIMALRCIKRQRKQAGIAFCGHLCVTVDEYFAIVEALEKQIPKKPAEIDEKNGSDYYYLAFICPNCEKSVTGQPYRPNRCKHCGQALDWSGEND